MGRILIAAGVVLVIAGFVFVLLEGTGLRPGRLPGDIRVVGKHGSFYFPVVTCILISAVMSLIFWLFGRR
jgi:hypothetical protein